MTYKTIIVDITDAVMTITMNRPERLNAWTYQMGSEMEAALKAGNEDEDLTPGGEVELLPIIVERYC